MRQILLVTRLDIIDLSESATKVIAESLPYSLLLLFSSYEVLGFFFIDLSASCEISAVWLPRKFKRRKGKLKSYNGYDFFPHSCKILVFFPSLFSRLPNGNSVEPRNIPVADCVKGAGGVGYGARGTGIVILVKVCIFSAKLLKAYCFRPSKLQHFSHPHHFWKAEKLKRRSTMHMLRQIKRCQENTRL